MLTLVADLLRRSRRFDEAQATAADALRSLRELDGDESFATTVDIARYIGSLAGVADDGAHCCGEAFAVEE